MEGGREKMEKTLQVSNVRILLHLGQQLGICWVTRRGEAFAHKLDLLDAVQGEGPRG